MADYIAIHQIERRNADGKPESTTPGSRLSVDSDEATQLLRAGAIRLAPQTTTTDTSGDDGASGTPNTKPPTVAEIEELAKTANRSELDKMLADEKVGKNRTTAVKAIEDAITALEAGSNADDAKDSDIL